MSEAKKQILIVSLYDRGFYLSNELAEQGHEVTLINLPYKKESTSFWSNPFGFFKKDNLTYNQKYYLDGPSTYQAEHGLSIWLNEGPIDFKSKFSGNILKSRDADNNWLKPLSESLFTTTNQLDKFMTSEQTDSDFSQDYSIKNADSDSTQYELKNTTRLGVNIVDANIDGITKDKSGEIVTKFKNETKTFDKVICLLSSYECEILNKALREFIFGNNVINPEWVWLRASFSFDPSEALEQVPEHFVALEDVDNIWAYKNLLFVRKNIKTNKLEVSFRWPFNERTNISYINDELAEIKLFFESKIKNIKLDIEPLVTEDLTPFYVYDEHNLKQFKSSLKKNKGIAALGPELWGSWDLSKIMKRQYDFTQGDEFSND